MSHTIPAVLRRIPRWIAWRLTRDELGKERKRPLGSTLDPNLGKPFDAIDPPPDGGRGFLMTKRVPLDGCWVIALDLDACRDPTTGELTEWATELWEHYDRTYTEITPSGTGLRVWLIVCEEPKPFRTIRVPHPAPEGVVKTPEIQGFGCGPAGYVTVTGNKLEGSADTLWSAPSLEWLLETYSAFETPESAEEELPVGVGPPPDPEAILVSLETVPDGPELLTGDWRGLGLPSASEAWWRLVEHALRAAHGHGRAAAFALLASPWGQGLIDSKEPQRYASQTWVMRDIARSAAKREHRVASPSAAFSTPVSDSWKKPEPKKRRSRLLKASEFVKQKRDFSFLVYGALPAHGIAQIYGEPGCGKTPVAMSLAVAIASGAEEWFGHEIDTHGDVVYMVGEGATGISNRLIGQLGGEPDEDLPLTLSTEPGRLMLPEDVASWLTDIRATIGKDTCALLVVDTQNRNFGPGNENSSEDATAFIANLTALAHALQCLVLLVHHTGHMHKDRGRGSSTIPAALDAVYEIRKDGKRVTITSQKTKEFQEPEPMIGTLVVATVGQDSKGRPVTSVTLEDREPKPGEIFGGGVDDVLGPVLATLSELHEEPVTQSKLAALTGLSRGTARGNRLIVSRRWT